LRFRELIFAQTEDYVEYSRHGKVLKGEEQTTIRSRYEEDVLNNNHTAVWGSWWQGGQWGYKCCHSTIKNSYCTGQLTFMLDEFFFFYLFSRAEKLLYD
jgi:pre-mRNA-processing factor SLU7